MTSLILNEEEAENVSHLVKAACKYGVVYGLLTAIESWQQNGKPDPDDIRFFEIATLSAGLARFKREVKISNS